MPAAGCLRSTGLALSNPWQVFGRWRRQSGGGKLIHLEPIGLIRTPYKDSAPHQPVERDTGDFRIVVDPRYREGLDQLESFRYLYVIFHFHRLNRQVKMMVSPPRAKGHMVGLFASRSPARPNPIGLSIVKIKKIYETVIDTSGIDVFDETPLLELKPYVKHLDMMSDANCGWLEDAVSRVESSGQIK